jgi:hypothetical protein
MPLMKYVAFVGSALVLLLLAMNWLLPDPSAEPVYSSVKRPVIRVSSIQKLPERVVFDTSMPYMAPPPSVMPGAAQPLQSAFTFEQIAPRLLPTPSISAQVAPKKPISAKRDPAKKVVTNRVASQAPIAAVRSNPVREAEQDTKPLVKTTFLDDIAGRFGQMFKVN